MKKSLISMAAVLFAALMTTTVLTSCSSNNNDEPRKPTFTKAVVKYKVTSNDATLGLFKVNVYGTDADGNGFVEAMSNPAYTKTVEIPVSKLPCMVELHTVATPLEDKASTEVFDFEVTRDIDVMTVNNDDTVVAHIGLSNTSTELNVPVGESLSELAKRMNSHQKIVIFIDANGNVTNQSKSSL
jgi:hypothetical protein